VQKGKRNSFKSTNFQVVPAAGPPRGNATILDLFL
jgi:hypothetical protein